MDHLNYSRWLPVYIMDMRHLQEKALNVYNEFLRGNHTVSRSMSQSFNQVWADMASEQTINLDTKTKGGIQLIGIMQKPSAFQKWFLTVHERIATTTATKRMIDLDESTRGTHKESSKVRVHMYDIKKVIHTLKTVMSDPFYEDAYKEDVPLMSLATGVVMPEKIISEQLIDAKCLGAARVKLLLIDAKCLGAARVKLLLL